MVAVPTTSHDAAGAVDARTLSISSEVRDSGSTSRSQHRAGMWQSHIACLLGADVPLIGTRLTKGSRRPEKRYGKAVTGQDAGNLCRDMMGVTQNIGKTLDNHARR